VSHPQGIGGIPPGAAGSHQDAEPGALEGSADVTTLFRERQAELVHLATLLLGSRAAAEDVVQDVFTRLYAKDRMLRGETALAYVRSAVVNGCRSALRRRTRAYRIAARRDTPAEALVHRSAEDEVLRAEDRRVLLLALGRLPRRRREVLVLRYWLGLPDKEIASVLGISLGTVKSTVARGLAAVARQLGEVR
jgi:RNA polymerase sigma-70 factor (sigma-E family)